MKFIYRVYLSKSDTGAAGLRHNEYTLASSDCMAAEEETDWVTVTFWLYFVMKIPVWVIDGRLKKNHR